MWGAVGRVFGWDSVSVVHRPSSQTGFPQLLPSDIWVPETKSPLDFLSRSHPVPSCPVCLILSHPVHHTPLLHTRQIGDYLLKIHFEGILFCFFLHLTLLNKVGHSSFRQKNSNS